MQHVTRYSMSQNHCAAECVMVVYLLRMISNQPILIFVNTGVADGFSILYSRKYWRELYLADCSKIEIGGF